MYSGARQDFTLQVLVWRTACRDLISGHWSQRPVAFALLELPLPCLLACLLLLLLFNVHLFNFQAVCSVFTSSSTACNPAYWLSPITLLPDPESYHHTRCLLELFGNHSLKCKRAWTGQPLVGCPCLALDTEDAALRS
jgi:hypothetical protein